MSKTIDEQLADITSEITEIKTKLDTCIQEQHNTSVQIDEFIKLFKDRADIIISLLIQSD